MSATDNGSTQSPNADDERSLVVVEPQEGAIEADPAVPGEAITIEPDSSSLATIESELQTVTEEEEAPDEAPAQSGTWDGQLPDTLVRVVEARLGIWQQLLLLEAGRRKLSTQASVREIREEMSRQERELQRAASPDALRQTYDDLQKRLSQPMPTADASGSQTAPQPGEPTPQMVYRKLLEMGITQCRLLQMRDQLDGSVTRAALPVASSEPLLALCRAHRIDGDGLLGWTFYALALFQKRAHYRALCEAHQARLAEARIEQVTSGLMSRLRSACASREEIPPLDPQVSQMRDAVERELKLIEPRLTEMFWALYPDIAWGLASGALAEAEKPTARALLRYGLVARHPGLIKPEVAEYIRKDCTEDVYAWANTPEALHVVYADEYITAIHDRRTMVSPDEDLELNHRGSPEWKADRAWRQSVISRLQSELYETCCSDLSANADRLALQRASQEKEYTAARSDHRRRGELTALGETLARTRATLGRLRQALERIEGKLIPELREKTEDVAQKMIKAIDVLTPEMVVRREAVFIRRLSRLSARLKEPYAQFVLRDWFVPGKPDHFGRTIVRETVARLEKADPRIFHHVLVTHKKLDRRTSVRLSPTFLIVPGRGQMGLSLCPRQWDDFGRLVLPLCYQRQNALEPTLIDMFADFRWDSSRAEAGIDWITADALCAAYATVRWTHRRMSEDAQRAFGFDRRQKDKQNWRSHYRLFVNSINERGRFLFHKSYDVYRDVVLRYMGLPPGVEPLRRD